MTYEDAVYDALYESQEQNMLSLIVDTVGSADWRHAIATVLRKAKMASVIKAKEKPCS